jgi:hypothetical protein
MGRTPPNKYGTNRSSSQPPLLPYGFSAPPNHYNHRLRLQFCIRLNICLPRFRDIYTHSASVDRHSLCLSLGCLLLPYAPFYFSSFFDFPPAYVTFRGFKIG